MPGPLVIIAGKNYYALPVCPINADGTPAGGGTQTVTPNVALLGASATQIIPAGAKGYSFVVLTGTASVGGVALIPAGVGDADPNTLAVALTITTAAASSAYVRWNT